MDSVGWAPVSHQGYSSKLISFFFLVAREPSTWALIRSSFFALARKEDRPSASEGVGGLGYPGTIVRAKSLLAKSLMSLIVGGVNNYVCAMHIL